MNTEEINAQIQTLIQTEVVKALASAPEYIDNLVQASLSQEVNEYGEKPDYSCRSKMPWLEWKCRDLIQKIADDVIREVVEESKDQIREAVKRAFESDAAATAVVDQIITSVASDWRFTLELYKQG